MELKVYILCGAPGSGKSTWGKNMVEVNPEIVRLCPDDFRAKFGTGEADQTVSAQAFSATKSGMKETLFHGKSVLIDATNMYRKTRKDFIDIAKEFDATIIAVVFEADKQTLLSRNQKRGEEGGRNVPEWVIDNMLSKYQTPSRSEGFNEIKFITKI
jgi:predicted kinase